MAFKFVILCAALAVANAGHLAAPLAYAPAPAIAYSAAPAVSHISYTSPVVSYGTPYGSAYPQTPAITSQSANILRSYGNLGQVSTYSKTIDTPFSSVSKSDVRVSNPGLRVQAQPAFGYAHAPVAYAAPVAHAPLSYAAPVAHAPAAIGVAYSAAPAVAHFTYSNGYGLSYGW